MLAIHLQRVYAGQPGRALIWLRPVERSVYRALRVDPEHDMGWGQYARAVLSFSLENDVPHLAHRAWHVRGLGDFWAHMLVAEGAVDGAVDAVGVSEWDLAAVQVIVEEAGGRFSDFAGSARIDGGSAVTSNGLLHDELLASVPVSS